MKAMRLSFWDFLQFVAFLSSLSSASRNRTECYEQQQSPRGICMQDNDTSCFSFNTDDCYEEMSRESLVATAPNVGFFNRSLTVDRNASRLCLLGLNVSKGESLDNLKGIRFEVTLEGEEPEQTTTNIMNFMFRELKGVASPKHNPFKDLLMCVEIHGVFKHQPNARVFASLTLTPLPPYTTGSHLVYSKNPVPLCELDTLTLNLDTNKSRVLKKERKEHQCDYRQSRIEVATNTTIIHTVEGHNTIPEVATNATTIPTVEGQITTPEDGSSSGKNARSKSKNHTKALLLSLAPILVAVIAVIVLIGACKFKKKHKKIAQLKKETRNQKDQIEEKNQRIAELKDELTELRELLIPADDLQEGSAFRGQRPTDTTKEASSHRDTDVNPIDLRDAVASNSNSGATIDSSCSTEVKIVDPNIVCYSAQTH